MYGRVATGADDQYELEKTITRYKATMMLFNVVSLIIGVATFSVCIWIRFDLDFARWVYLIDWYTYWYATYVIMITMVWVMVNSIIGILGVYQQNLTLNYAHSICMGILIVLHLIGAVVIIVYGVEESKSQYTTSS